MTVVRVTDNLAQVVRFGAVNCYLVREGDRSFTVIDTGVPGTHSDLLIAAKELGGSITGIVLTHAHSDHTGSLRSLRKSLPKVQVLVPRREERLLRGDFSLDPGEANSALPIMFFAPIRNLPVDTFEPGETIGSLEAIATPGHTPGHVSFLDSRDGTLISGDAFQVKGGLSVSGVFRPMFPLPAWANWDGLTALQSAIELRDRNPTRLAAGHGSVLENPLDLMDSAIGEARYKLGN